MNNSQKFIGGAGGFKRRARAWIVAASSIQCVAAFFVLAASAGVQAADAIRPNILWITCEDIGPQLGCYGDAYADTPVLDALAARGMRYRTAWSNAPVCAPARTTIITGVYPPSLGAQHMRSSVALPTFMRMYPQFLREVGYYCTNNSKEDYNVEKPGQVWDASSNQAHWKNRRQGQPFFAIFNLTGTHESQIRKRPHQWVHDPAKAPVPAYHPDTPEVRLDWAQYYDNITVMDGQVGRLLDELREAGLEDDTIVFFYGDHGSGMPRSKRWPFNSGLHVPMMVYVPEKFRDLAPVEYGAGAVSDRLVGFIDLAPTLLSLVGVHPPEWMQGRAFMGRFETEAPAHLFGFRGRMDERIDMVRSVRNQRYIYIRNYLPHLIYGQHVSYMFETPTTQVWRNLYDEGQLAPPQTFFWERKPAEELYDLQADPDETINLARSTEHQMILRELRRAQTDLARKIRDVGFLGEAEMHRRATGGSVYELGHDPSRYPMDRILAMADTASMLDPRATDALRAGLRDSDNAVRYWAALGLLMRGSAGVEAGRDGLISALNDEAVSVRVIAASALGQFGRDEDLPKALAVLRAAASPVANGAYASILAVNAIDSLGEKATSLRDYVRSMPAVDPNAPGRANGYVARLQADLHAHGDR